MFAPPVPTVRALSAFPPPPPTALPHRQLSEHPLTTKSLPPWRLRLSQWDMSHNAIPLALFAYTGVLQSFVQTSTPFTLPAQLWYVAFYVSVAVLAVCFLLTMVRVYIHPQGIVNDFRNPRLVNFFFLPAIIGSMALLTAPPTLRSYTASLVGFYLTGTYQCSMVLYVLGEWLFKRAVIGTIYPLVFMQTIAFFLLSIVASTLSLPEQAVAMLSIGTLLWGIVLITNFQHLSDSLSTTDERPAPTFFLFIAPPAQAVLAVLFLSFADANPGVGFLDVTKITEFPVVSRVALYIDFFLYLLMFRLVPTWWGSKFSVAWWAYVFPLSAATCAVVWRFHTSQDMFYMVVTVVSFVISTVAVGVVAGLTVWAVWKGTLPKNPARECEFRDVWEKSRRFENVGDVGSADISADISADVSVESSI